MPIRINNDNKNKLDSELSGDDYFRGIANFNRFFRERTTHNPIGTILLVPWASFESEVEQERIALGIAIDRTVVAFFHGLDENKKVRTGFSVFGVERDIVESVEIDINMPIADQRIFPKFEIVEDTNIVSYSGTNRRIHKIQKAEKPWDFACSYFAKVQVHRAPEISSNPTFADVDQCEDSRKIMFPWKREIMELERSNRVISKTPYLIISDFTSFIVNGQTRVIVKGENGYYHSKAMHIGSLDTTNVITDELNTGNSVLLVNFQGQALDYGNMCPPLCDRVRF